MVMRIGVAGWTIAKPLSGLFGRDGTHLQRYAARFNAVEINSSFYRPHKPTTYARWGACVPPEFKFSVKLPREITHRLKLVAATDLLDRFLGEATCLGTHLGPILVQLPPSLAYDAKVAGAFFEKFRARFEGSLVCEPRHASWFTVRADKLLRRLHVGRVAADPAPHPLAAFPGGWRKLTYRRLHGSPRMYYSAYSKRALTRLKKTIAAEREAGGENWCIFDNTALGHAVSDALALDAALNKRRERTQ